MKPIERRIGTLKEHIKQGEIYRKYKGKKRLSDSEQILFTAARKYLNAHLNGHKLDLDAWKRELGTKNAERDVLYREYTALKEDTAKVEKIKRSVRDILHSESTERRQSARTYNIKR